LKTRLREKASKTSAGFSISQLSILERLRLGSATAASLAAAEHVTQQASAQSLVPLRQATLAPYFLTWEIFPRRAYVVYLADLSTRLGVE
jgi:hypothetical protein